jgi:CheY-like chemotaxis protein
MYIVATNKTPFCYIEISNGAFMKKGGEIIIIEDDPDDQQMLGEVFKSLEFPNKITFFPDGARVLDYLLQPDVFPFLILSDINLPILNGFELRDRIFQNEEISRKCIPYLFFTTAADEKSVVTAYAHSAQGYFKKPHGYKELETTIKTIIEYWNQCYSPNRFRQH